MKSIAEQIAEKPPTMRLDTMPGEKVRFLGFNGYDRELEAAKRVLTVGETYEVESVSVSAWDSSVTLKGCDGRFNTVMFQNAEPFLFDGAH